MERATSREELPRRGVAVLLLVAFAASCFAGDRDLPTELADGSSVRAVPVELEDVSGPVVLTRARATRVESVAGASPTAECVGGRAGAAELAGLAVERVGVHAQSVTLREASGRGLLACDDAPEGRAAGRRWCGGSYGVLQSGRLRDPRLNLLCSTADGEAMGFLWIEPRRATRYVALEQSGFTEAYPVAGNLPVRVSTIVGVDVERSGVDITVSEHDAMGLLVRRYDLHAEVAG